jgi:hypothetical protein
MKFKNHSENDTTDDVLGDHLLYNLPALLQCNTFISKYMEPPKILTMASIEQRIPPWHVATIGISNGLHGNKIFLINRVRNAFLPFRYAPETRK